MASLSTVYYICVSFFCMHTWVLYCSVILYDQPHTCHNFRYAVVWKNIVACCYVPAPFVLSHQQYTLLTWTNVFIHSVAVEFKRTYIFAHTMWFAQYHLFYASVNAHVLFFHYFTAWNIWLVLCFFYVIRYFALWLYWRDMMEKYIG